MIKEDQVKSFKEKGYLVIENLLPENILKDLQKITEDFVEKSKFIKENDLIFDLSDDHTPENPVVRRLKDPHLNHSVYSDIIKNNLITDVVSKLIGNNIRLEHTKLNFKSAKGGEAIEWHQDWAFYPHTNDDIVEVGIFLDDCGNENGPLLCVPGSHKGPIDDHHQNGYFIGAVDPSKSHYNLETAEPIVAKAGSISVHHVRCLHGSRKNNSEKSRRVLFAGYCAADAWPLRGILDSGIKPNTSEGDFVGNVYSAFRERMIKGKSSLVARVEANPVRMPYPPSPNIGSIYENQKEVLGRSFGE
ncbi:MAG TPA: phytanoyl-CoA dioxygenase family protein [Pelagibacterales bacterium]|jgi:ectoine hydroxylase-related dioxygenase (phytanoyl-CoA dioxygenase family)|nr:phytanoyl-CoA dioxygenase family protein [Pelagibacterales bacterium]|tara:strand:- start:3393 stop:4301 length:909 start_codon:yes stop_codon:yes gene_type:complete